MINSLLNSIKSAIKIVLLSCLFYVGYSVASFFDFELPTLQEIFLKGNSSELMPAKPFNKPGDAIDLNLIVYTNKSGEVITADYSEVCYLVKQGYLVRNKQNGAIELCIEGGGL